MKKVYRRLICILVSLLIIVVMPVCAQADEISPGEPDVPVSDMPADEIADSETADEDLPVIEDWTDTGIDKENDPVKEKDKNKNKAGSSAPAVSSGSSQSAVSGSSASQSSASGAAEKKENSDVQITVIETEQVPLAAHYISTEETCLVHVILFAAGLIALLVFGIVNGRLRGIIRKMENEEE